MFGAVDAEGIWESITEQAATAPISFIRDLGVHGRTYRVPMRITLNRRTADVMTVWQYEYEDAAPRLVTAYPTT